MIYLTLALIKDSTCKDPLGSTKVHTTYHKRLMKQALALEYMHITAIYVATRICVHLCGFIITLCACARDKVIVLQV